MKTVGKFYERFHKEVLGVEANFPVTDKSKKELAEKLDIYGTDILGCSCISGFCSKCTLKEVCDKDFTGIEKLIIQNIYREEVK